MVDLMKFGLLVIFFIVISNSYKTAESSTSTVKESTNSHEELIKPFVGKYQIIFKGGTRTTRDLVSGKTKTYNYGNNCLWAGYNSDVKLRIDDKIERRNDYYLYLRHEKWNRTFGKINLTTTVLTGAQQERPPKNGVRLQIGIYRNDREAGTYGDGIKYYNHYVKLWPSRNGSIDATETLSEETKFFNDAEKRRDVELVLWRKNNVTCNYRLKRLDCYADKDDACDTTPADLIGQEPSQIISTGPFKGCAKNGDVVTPNE